MQFGRFCRIFDSVGLSTHTVGLSAQTASRVIDSDRKLIIPNLTVDLGSGGYLAAGYDTVHVDDCALQRGAGGRLQAVPERFPTGGMAGLAKRLAAKGVALGLYTDEGTHTCGGFDGSKGHEAADAEYFASVGASYVKVDGCYSNASDYASGYAAFGKALEHVGGIAFSCSWPAYLGDDETSKPYDAMVDAGCDLWRNWDDIQCSYESLISIITHYGKYSHTLASAAPWGTYNDPDMLLVGAGCLTEGEERMQMAVWSVLAAPLIMGNDLRRVSATSRALLTNPEVIAIDQDFLGTKGALILNASGTSVWTRPLENDSLAVAVVREDTDVPAIGIDLAALGWPYDTANVRDTFAREDLGEVVGTIRLAVPSRHDARLFVLTLL